MYQSRSDFDELVRKKCGRLSPQEVARTGYSRMSDYDKSYIELYRDVETQEKFGVPELAFSRASPFEKLHSGRSLGSGEGVLSDGIKTYVPKIAEVKHRQSIFDENGKPKPADVPEDLRQELADAKRRIELLEEVERPVMIEREREALREAESAEERLEETINKREIERQVTTQQLKEAYIDFINSSFPEREDRQNAGLPSVSEFMQKLNKEQKVELLSQLLGGADVLIEEFNVERRISTEDLPEPEPEPQLEEEEEEEEQPDID
jgi:hypothetical protein